MSLKKNIRLLHIGKFYPPHNGGMESHLQALCEGLVGQTNVQVLVSNNSFETFFEMVNGVPVLRVGRLTEVSSNSLCPTLPFWARLFRADIIHLHLPNPMAHLAYLFCGKKSRLVITWHSDIIRQKRMLRFYHPFLLRLLHRADEIIATSDPYIKNSPYLKRFSEKTKTIPLGIDASGFVKTSLVKSEVIKINKMYGPGPFILFVGRLTSYKGLLVLIRAMVNIPAKLLIVGDGPEKEAGEGLVTELQMQRKVFFCGKVRDGNIAAYYHACTVFVLSSTERSEAFGIVQLEAMASGKPVVSTNLKSGVPFVNLHERTGVVVEPGCSEALAGGVNMLLENEALRRRYGNSGRARVQGLFTREKMVKSTLDLYRGLV